MDKGGNIVLEAITDDNGQIAFILNDEGQYTVKLTDAPYDYFIMPVCDITVNKKNVTEKEEYEQPGEVAKTGDANGGNMLYAILALFGSAIALVALRKRED